jgi:flagellar protein FlbD
MENVVAVGPAATGLRAVPFNRNAGMIRLTRLNDRPFILNAEQIKTIEQTPDTMITLLTGEHVVVREKMEEVVLRAIEYGRALRAFQSA